MTPIAVPCNKFTSSFVQVKYVISIVKAQLLSCEGTSESFNVNVILSTPLPFMDIWIARYWRYSLGVRRYNETLDANWWFRTWHEGMPHPNYAGLCSFVHWVNQRTIHGESIVHINKGSKVQELTQHRYVRSVIGLNLIGTLNLQMTKKIYILYKFKLLVQFFLGVLG